MHLFSLCSVFAFGVLIGRRKLDRTTKVLLSVFVKRFCRVVAYGYFCSFVLGRCANVFCTVYAMSAVLVSIILIDKYVHCSCDVSLGHALS